MPSGGLAVASQRLSPIDSLDDFPTPPWATRALFVHVLQPLLGMTPYELNAENWSVWEPAANRRIMADVIAERTSRVWTSDVHDYGYPLDEVGSFPGAGGLDLDLARGPVSRPDWVISNPPFTLGTEFVERALGEAASGVAMLLRTNWIESEERFDLFARHQPAVLAPFACRVPMIEHRWDPDASSMTSYSWFVWLKPPVPRWEVMMIPYHVRTSLTRPDDRRRFASRTKWGHGGQSLVAERMPNNVHPCPDCARMFKDGETCAKGGCPMGGDF
jgi:hypothetical protein